MRLKHWLLTGTSLTLLTLTPFVAAAQETVPELPQECIDAGFTTLEDCIVAQSAEGAESSDEAAPEQAPVDETAAEPDAAPADEPPAEPAADPAVVEPEPEVTGNEPQPEMSGETAPVPETAPEGLQDEAPLTTEEAPAEEFEAQSAQEAPAAQEQEAPAQQQVAPADQNVTEQAAPQEATQTPDIDISAELQAELDAYNAAIADMMAGGDVQAAQAQIAQARQNIADLCAAAGVPDIDTCLAGYGLSLPAVPTLPEAEVVAPTVQPGAVDAETTLDSDVTIDNEVTVDNQVSVDAEVSQDLPVEPVEELPQGITQEQIAPVFDSAKENNSSVEGAATTQVQAEPEAPEATAAPQAASAPPPESDAAAQTLIAVEEMPPVSEEEGEQVSAAALVPEAVPQNVTIVNQTNVVNNTTNNTTVNNTTTNIDRSQNNIGEQTNVEINQNNVQVNQDNRQIDITQTILQVGAELIVRSVGQDTARFYNADEDEIFYENLSNGRTRETITRPDGSQIITVRNRNGDILRRSRIDPAGREYVLAYFNDDYSEQLIEWRDPAEDLPPLRLNIAVEDYVLDAAFADEQQVEVFFRQPPVEQVARLYSIDEVKRSARVRDSVRKLEIGGLTFDTGAATIGRDQVGALSNVASGMLALLKQDPTETFLIEGHTDAVGSDISNLQLSDLRAATVARILTDFYDVPPENLATQGYGERYLKIRSEGDVRENRRVTIRRITPLITVAQD